MEMNVNRELIRELRLRKSWSQEKLADVAGVSMRTVQRIETDGAASLQSLNALAEALSIEPKVLQFQKTEMQTDSQRLNSNDCTQPQNRLVTLPSKERQYVKESAQEAERLEAWLSYNWVGWVLLFIGGYLTVDVLLMAQANLTRTVIFNVLFPGIAIGQILMFIGAYGIYLARKASKEKMILAKLLSPNVRIKGLITNGIYLL